MTTNKTQPTIGQTFTVKGSKSGATYEVRALGDYGSGRTIYAERIDGGVAGSIYFRADRIIIK